MFTLTSLLLLLNIPILMVSFIHSRCFWRLKPNEDKERNFLLSCPFAIEPVQRPMHLEDWDSLLDIHKTTKKYPFDLALAFSLDEVNRNSRLLPNISLKFRDLAAGCILLSELYERLSAELENELYALLPNYHCEMEPSCDVLLTGPNWETSAAYQTYILQPQEVLQLSYGPFHPVLDDREQFPYLIQMAPKDISLAMAMVSFILYFSWNWIGLVISDNDVGIEFLWYLRQEMEKNTVCLAFVNMIPVNMQLYMSRADVYYNQMVTSSTNVVILYGDIDSTLAMSSRMWDSLSTQRIWITTSQWDVSINKRDFPLDSLHLTFVFAHHHADILGLKSFLRSLNPFKYSDKYLASQEWMYFTCDVLSSKLKTLKNCSSSTSLDWLMEQTFDMAFIDGSYHIYNAVYAVAHALHEIAFLQADHRPMIYKHKLNVNCTKLHSFVRKTHFTNPVGDRVNMNQREKLGEDYDIYQVSKLQHSLGLKVKIGSFSPYFPRSQQLHLSVDAMEWATGDKQMLPSVCSDDCGPGFRKFSKEGMAACCFECSPCPENEISNETNMDECVMCPEDQYANPEQNHCRHKAVVFLSYEDPLGMALALIALCFTAFTAVVFGVFVKHHGTPVVKANNRTLSYLLLMSLLFCFLCSLLFLGRPNSATCILQQITFGIAFTVAISTVLAKTITVVLAFKVTAPRQMKYILVSGAPNYVIPICSLSQCVLCVIWLWSSPPFVDTDAHSEHGHIIILCNKGSVTAFYCVLGYLACLALGSFTVAFLARNLPDTFNEAKYLTFSMLVFCSVWVSFIPVYHSTKGKVMVAVEIFSILASTAGMLGCIFVPKVYIILLRPHRNSVQKIREKCYS
ncbi:vomeronasal type-2 receptor 116-like [Acomys russatus]|uniref:vomeronasal type-2 receptor 116-like n=1 Tax=Acomys russatus TaxID=60746 RepID=UPI0021E1F0FA|nr:vomeronasal type-2 receptor 116-like [Acomys russatus]